MRSKNLTNNRKKRITYLKSKSHDQLCHFRLQNYDEFHKLPEIIRNKIGENLYFCTVTLQNVSQNGEGRNRH